jgi:hypothetical protein
MEILMSNGVLSAVTNVALAVLVGVGFIEYMNHAGNEVDMTIVNAQKPNIDSIVTAFKEAKMTDTTITLSRKNFSEILRNYKKISASGLESAGPQSAKQAAKLDSLICAK